MDEINGPDPNLAFCWSTKMNGFARFAKKAIYTMLFGALMSVNAIAGDVEIVGVEATRSGDTWWFSVTLKHADEGWDHYANLWQVIAPDGSVLGERVLAHPHVNEQPFTRSLGGVVIPDGIDTVTIRARDSVHGIGKNEQSVSLTN